MRPLLHLLSLILVLPSVLLAAAFIVLGRAIATKSLLAILGQLLDYFVWLVPWGILGVLAALLLIAAGGFFARTRRMAAMCVAVLGAGGIVVPLTMIMSHAGISLGDLPFFIPGAVATCIAVWLAAFDRNDGLPPGG